MKIKSTFYIIVILCVLTLPAFSAIYHIDPAANAGGDGSFASPLQKWTELPTMLTGDDVFIKCGTTLQPSRYLSINWEGTVSDPVVIGAYYEENNKAVYAVKGSRPTISGSNYTVPSNKGWQALIDVSSKDYIQIKDLHIYQSGFYGIKIWGNLRSGANSAHFLLKNVKVEGTYNGGIMVSDNPKNYGIIEDCEVTGGAWGWKYDHVSKGGSWGGTWAICLAVNNSPYSNTIVRRNYVHENWGEGIGTYRDSRPGSGGSGYVTIEDNVVWNSRRVDIYIDSTDNNIVRNNICAGAGAKEVEKYKSTSAADRGWNQFGIWVNNEIYNGISHTANNNLIYRNYVAGHYAGIGISSEVEIGVMVGNKFYNNTAIGNYLNYMVGSKIRGLDTDNNVFKNNVSYCPPDSTCKDVSSDHTWIDDKIQSSHNAWTNIPTNWGSVDDKKVNDNWSKNRNWQKLIAIPSVKDFMPTLGNPVIGSGDPLPDERFDIVLSANNTDLQVSPLKLSHHPIANFASTGDWDIGAVPYQKDNQIVAPQLRIIVGH